MRLFQLEELGADTAGRARWLEQAIAGSGLASLVDEIAAITGAGNDWRTASAGDARQWLEPEATAVLQDGLTRLPRAKLDELLHSPGLLLGLQELVLVSGGCHWEHVTNSDPGLIAQAERQRESIARQLDIRGAAPEAGRSPTHGTSPPSRIMTDRPAWNARRWLTAALPLAVAAGVTGVILSLRQDPAPRADIHPPLPTDPAATASRDPRPAPDGDGPTRNAGATGDWPAHPWGAIGRQQERPVSTDTLARLAFESAHWRGELRAASDLSGGQVVAATDHARAAISVIGSLAADGKLPLSAAKRADLEAACRVTSTKLGDLRARIAADTADPAVIAEARSDLVRLVEEMEAMLGKSSSAER